MNDLKLRATALSQLLEGPGQGADVPVSEALISCCSDLVAAGDPRTALSLIARAKSLHVHSLEDRLRLKIMFCKALRFAGRYSEALGEIRECIASDETCILGDQGLVNLRIMEAACLWHLNRIDEAISNLLTLRAGLLSRPDSEALASCMFELSSAELFGGSTRRARAYALEALVSARRCGDRVNEAKALNNLGRIDRFLCRWASSEESSDEARLIYEEQGHSVYANNAKRAVAIVAWKQGRLERALLLAQQCIDEASELGLGINEWYASLLKGIILLHRGAHPSALSYFARDPKWAVPEAESRPSLLTQEFIGDALLEQGRGDSALEHYDRVWSLALALVPNGDIVAELRRRRAECLLHLGDAAGSYEAARAGVDHCRALGDRYEEAASYRVLALAAAKLGNAAEARSWFDQGFAYYDDIETPYEWGKLWMAYGDFLSGPNAGEFADLRGAIEAYQAARDHFDRMGAQAKLSQAEARLAELVASHARAAGFVEANVSTSLNVKDVRKPPRRPRGATELERRAAWAFETFGLVTRNRGVLDLLDEVAKLAGANTPILVLGESGTGKELVAHGIHKLSGRAGNFLPVNCSALPRDMVESELFGHVAGAFTGATREKMGIMESCDGGTVFLDEIGDMSLELQSRLLRFLETGEFRRVGSVKIVAADALVIAATNRDRASLEKGEGFRTDLYYRLAHAVVVLPSLRRRPEDIDPLIDYFWDETCRRMNKSATLSHEARNKLIAFSWPGNVRQLRTTIARLAVLANPNEPLGPEAIRLEESQVAGSLVEELEHSEKKRIVEALTQSRGVRTDAARSLGMSRTTLLGKMKRYGIR